MRDVFIIGSGNSLNSLSSDEVNYVNTCETISLNRYPIFYDFVGITPKNNVYIDNNQRTKGILTHILNKVRQDKLSTKLFFSTDILYGVNTAKWKFPPYINQIHNSGCQWAELKTRKSPLDFATTLNDYFYQIVSLGTAINLAIVLYGTDIKIKCLGIDGGATENFSTRLLKYLNKNNHSTVQFVKDLIDDEPSVHHSSMVANPILRNHLYSNKKCPPIYVCSNRSNLIDEKLFKFTKIIE